jgi:hypothetical protein
MALFFWKVKSRQRIAEPNLNHGLFFVKSNRAIREIIAKINHDFFFWKVKSHQRIVKPNLNRGLFFEVKSRKVGNNC